MSGSHQDYHADRSHISRSDLVTFAFSRRAFLRKWQDHYSESENDALTIGKGSHAIALRDTLELKRIVEIPANVLSKTGARVGNRFTKFRLQNRDKILMLPGQFELCQAIANEFMKIEIADGTDGRPITVLDLINDPRSLREFEVRWNDILPCRIKADLVLVVGDPDRPDFVICLDLKTARSRNPKSFRSEVRDRKLWLQVSHYSAGLAHRFQCPVRFVFVVVEKVFPFRAGLFELNPETAERAEVGRRRLLTSLKKCLESGDFSDTSGREPIVQIGLTAEEMLGEIRDVD